MGRRRSAGCYAEEIGMKMAQRKWWKGIFTGMLLAAVLTAGCGAGRFTNEEVVVARSPETENEQMEVKMEGSLQEQLLAPARWRESFAADGIEALVDADVVVPDADGIRLWKMEGRTFAQQDYEAMNRVILKGDGNIIYVRNRTNETGEQELSKEEIAEQIEALQEKMSSGEAGSRISGEQAYSYEEAMKELEARLEQAPDKFIAYDSGKLFSKEEGDFAECREKGYMTASGREYCFSVENDLYSEPGWRDICMVLLEDGAYGGIRDGLSADEQEEWKAKLRTTPEEFEKKAAELAEELGMTQYRVAGGEVVSVGSSWQQSPGYLVHFTREVEGVQVNYRSGYHGRISGLDLWWDDESFGLLYDDDGVAGMIWQNPYVLREGSEGFANLLSFDRIQDVFRKMMPEKYKGLGNPAEFVITKVQLGYMRAWESGDAVEATLIPVWDFYGYQKGVGEEGKSFYSAMTINAMDGTVPER